MSKKEPHVLDIKKIRIMLGVSVMNRKVSHSVMEVIPKLIINQSFQIRYFKRSSSLWL